jgi:hypothetical protein
LIKSEDWFAGNLDAGETTTFTASHRSDPRMHHFNVAFKAYTDAGVVQLKVLRPND